MYLKSTAVLLVFVQTPMYSTRAFGKIDLWIANLISVYPKRRKHCDLIETIDLYYYAFNLDILFTNLVAVSKDRYVVYACGFDWNGKWEWFCESKWRCKNDVAKMRSQCCMETTVVLCTNPLILFWKFSLATYDVWEMILFVLHYNMVFLWSQLFLIVTQFKMDDWWTLKGQTQSDVFRITVYTEAFIIKWCLLMHQRKASLVLS